MKLAALLLSASNFSPALAAAQDGVKPAVTYPPEASDLKAYAELVLGKLGSRKSLTSCEATTPCEAGPQATCLPVLYRGGLEEGMEGRTDAAP